MSVECREYGQTGSGSSCWAIAIESFPFHEFVEETLLEDDDRKKRMRMRIHNRFEYRDQAHVKSDPITNSFPAGQMFRPPKQIP